MTGAVPASLAVLVVLSSCATATAPRPRTHPAPAASELLQVLERRQVALRTLELESRTTSWLGGDRVRATVLMLVDRAGRLRFAAEVPVFEGTMASLAVNGRDFSFVDFEKRLFRKGPACPANVALMIPIPLQPEEIAAILLGDAPLGQTARATGVTWDGKNQAEVLALERPSAGGAAAMLWVSLRRRALATGHDYDVVAVEGQSPGAPGRWRVAYEDLTRQGDLTLPGVIRFAEPGRNFDDGVEIKIRERMGINRPFDDAIFVLGAPPGFKVESLPCLPPASPRP